MSFLINWFNKATAVKTFAKNDKIFNELVEDSFKTQLKQHSKLDFNSQKYLSRKIKSLIKKFDSKYYGLFTTLCQSSGFGKTRACEALVDENIYVVYCCLRKQSSTGYPPRSFMADFLQFPQTDEETLIRKYKCYLNMYIDIVSSEKIGCRDFFQKYSHNNKEILLNSIENKLKLTERNTLLSVYLGSEPLVFIFDESSTLLDSNSTDESSYFILRRVLSELQGNVLVLFLDTFTNLREYHPQKSADPSARIASSQKILFEPIYLLPNWDLFADYDSVHDMNDTVKIENMCRFGRVIWGSLMYTRQNSNGKFISVSDDKIYDLAISKILGGRKWNFADLNDNECLAVASFRIGTIKPRRISTCQDLVAKNMAICTSVSTTNDFFEIEFASEPILAIASAFLINDFGIDKVLESITKSIESSLISQGDKGETIAKFILINTIDTITSSKQSKKEIKYLKLTRVGEFIQQLYGKCEKNCGSFENQWKCQNDENREKFVCATNIINRQVENCTKILNGFINFNHFLKLNFWLTETSLEQSLKRCAAIHCKFEQQGIDLVIPVCLNPNNFDSISAIMIQVKLNSKPRDVSYLAAFDSISHKLFNDMDPKMPYLLLYMQLGESSIRTPSIKNIKSYSHRGAEHLKRAIIYSEGISEKIFPNLDPNFIQKLKNFRSLDQKLYDDDAKIYETIFSTIRK